MVNQPLFRQEVLAENQSQWLGTVLLAPRLSYRLFVAFALLAAGALFALLFLGSYTRKARITGWLVPQQGLVQVYAPQAGVIRSIAIAEGAEVRQGDPLLVLSSELQSTAQGATQGLIAGRLEARRASMVQVRGQIGPLADQRARSLRNRIATLVAEATDIDSSIALQRERMQLAVKTENRQRDLRERGLISDTEMQAASEARIEQESKLRDLERSQIVSRRDRLALQGELDEIPFQMRTDMSNADRDIAQVEQDLAEAEARREIVVSAPEAGTVTSMQAERGARAEPGVPLLSIVPAGSALEADLFSPSRSIGFLRPGQRVLLRYEAYPYQKFGHYEGQIASISRSALNPGELPAQVAGLTSLIGTNEPVYRITVRLQSQHVNAYGKPVPLQPGMQLEADVLIESRRLIEWMLDPLYTLTGKLRG
jgi:membrane fusion protein